ncbi:hypothetical protein PV04_09609 [Phialophora macrospora]|uniref:Uncharacterized protein n=1 Tax=Phialophora macrospora TaxID=1851006 RepID=A0A0D2CHI1_9EURO|nr:hypothetical protein PV04_09609 [Phialophora macrospora]
MMVLSEGQAHLKVQASIRGSKLCLVPCWTCVLLQQTWQYRRRVLSARHLAALIGLRPVGVFAVDTPSDGGIVLQAKYRLVADGAPISLSASQLLNCGGGIDLTPQGSLSLPGRSLEGSGRVRVLCTSGHAAGRGC